MAPFLVRRLRTLGVLLALPLFTTGAVLAQSGTVQGVVADSSGGALSGAQITVDGTTLRATSTSTGRYVLRGVPTGTQTFRVRAIGFAPASATLTIGPGDLVEHNFTMSRSAVELAPIDVVVGSRARHTAADELAVPVDVYSTEQIAQQGSSETSVIISSLSPSVNFPRQSVTDANDIVRPFTLRGLSPDHSLVLVNGWRRHQTALVNTFPYGSGAGSSGVDLNAIPGGAIDRIEVLRDGASAQYGSDAIAGVINLVMKEGQFAPYLNTTASKYVTDDYPDDGTTVDINGGIGIGVGRGSLGLFAEYLHRDPTNRAWADKFLADAAGVTDVIDPKTGQVTDKRNSLTQPNLHWGDGLEKDIMTFANFRMPLNAAGSTEFYAFGGYSNRVGTGNGFFRYVDSPRNWQEIYPQGFLPRFHPNVDDYSVAGGIRTSLGGWALDFGGSFGLDEFDYNLDNTLNSSLGPCLDTPCAPGADGVLGTGDDPNIPNTTTFFAGSLQRSEVIGGLNLAKALNLGLPGPLNVAVGAAIRGENYQIIQGDSASWVNGNHLAQDSASGGGAAPAGSSVFSGFRPTDASDNSRSNFGAYADLETNLTPQLLVNVAGRFESYSDFGERVTGKLALRFQPSKRIVFRGAASTGFRAPGLPQSYFSHVTTSFIAGNLIEVGNVPVNDPAAQLFGAKPLKEETSINYSAGVAFTPRDDLSFTVDYFHITINDRILLGATFSDSVSQAILVANGYPGIGGVQFFTNGLDTKTDGVDVTADYRVPVGSTGTLNLNANFNYTRNHISRVDPLPAILQGTPTIYTSILDDVTRLGIELERPEYRSTVAAIYNQSRFHGLARGSYYGKFRSAQPSFFQAETFAAKTLFDAEIGYRFEQIDISVGARNIFDTYPQQASARFNNNDGTFPWAAASPFGYNGRSIYTRAEMILGW